MPTSSTVQQNGQWGADGHVKADAPTPSCDISPAYVPIRPGCMVAAAAAAYSAKLPQAP